MEGENFDRFNMAERPGGTKAFSFDKNHVEMVGKSHEFRYASYPDYKVAVTAERDCIVNAQIYAEDMAEKFVEEDRGFFARQGIDQENFMLQLVSQMCAPKIKLAAKSFKDTTAKINEKNYLNDDIRRLYNGGDKFHPYL